MRNENGFDPVALDRWLTTPPDDDDGPDQEDAACDLLFRLSRRGLEAVALLEAAGYEWNGWEWTRTGGIK
jgi:hypothetical protein